MTSSHPTNIAVLGAGYVGLTTAVALAHLGHRVVCVDIDEERIATLRQGDVPIVEDGMEAMMAASVAGERLSFSQDPSDAVGDASVVFLCVPTPSDDEGRADLSYIKAASQSIRHALRAGTVIVNKSTVPVGSTKIVEAELQRDDVFVVSNPEFLREGTALSDFLHPDRIVIGADSPYAAEVVAQLYAALDTKLIITDPASAETIKYAANAFLATKISFINAVAAMCEAVGADVADVVAGIGTDHRIGPRFLQPGPGWGGSCFPKDTRALVSIAADHGYDFALVRGVIEVNDEQRRRILDKIRDAAGGDLNGVVVAALGLTFKAHTDDLRDSPAVHVIRELLDAGAVVRVYDPTVVLPLHTSQARLIGDIVGRVAICTDAVSATTDAAVTVVLTEWPEFVDIDLEAVAGAMAPLAAVVDARNLLDPAMVRKVGLSYDGVGRC